MDWVIEMSMMEITDQGLSTVAVDRIVGKGFVSIDLKNRAIL